MRRSSSLTCGELRCCSMRWVMSRMRRSISASGRMSGPCATRVESCSTAARSAITSPPLACAACASSIRAFTRSTSPRRRCISAGPAPEPESDACASFTRPTMRPSMARSSCCEVCTACVCARVARFSAVSRTVSMRLASSVSSVFNRSGRVLRDGLLSLRSTRCAKSAKRDSSCVKAGACLLTESCGAVDAFCDSEAMRSCRDLKLSRVRFSELSICSTILRTAFSSAMYPGLSSGRASRLLACVI